MIKKDVLKIITTIEEFYNKPWTRHFKQPDQQQNLIGEYKTKEDVILDVVNTWHKILKDYEFDIVAENLKEYIKTNRFAPTVADLIKAPERRDRAVLNQEETKAMFEQWEQSKNNVASKEIANDHLAKMRDILGIKRGE